MPSLEFFRQAGLFVLPDFLDPKFVADLCKVMTVAPTEKALVVKSSGVERLDENTRKVGSSIVPKEIRADLRKKLVALVPQLEKHFKVKLGGCEPPSFLIYRPTDFFRPHKDGGNSSGNSDSRRRRVSATIFLNPESAKPQKGAYGQGELTFYGLLEGPHWDRCPIHLSPQPGLFIAFPSEMIHEVTPVSHGQRLTVVTWFYARPRTKVRNS